MVLDTVGAGGPRLCLLDASSNKIAPSLSDLLLFPL